MNFPGGGLIAGTARHRPCGRHAGHCAAKFRSATAELWADVRLGPCPKRVKVRSPGVQPASRLYPQLRTWPCTAQTDALCQQLTHAAQQRLGYSITLSALEITPWSSATRACRPTWQRANSGPPLASAAQRRALGPAESRASFLTPYGARRTRSLTSPTATRINRTGALTPRNIAVSSSRSRSASAASVSASFATASDTITSPPRH